MVLDLIQSLPQFPDKVQSYDDAVMLVREASNLRHLSKTLLQHVKFQLIKAQREVTIMESKLDAAENRCHNVISLVAESGYSVSISAGREPRVTVKKVSSSTGKLSIVAISPSSLDHLQFPLCQSHHKDIPPLLMLSLTEDDTKNFCLLSYSSFTSAAPSLYVLAKALPNTFIPVMCMLIKQEMVSIPNQPMLWC